THISLPTQPPITTSTFAVERGQSPSSPPAQDIIKPIACSRRRNNTDNMLAEPKHLLAAMMAVLSIDHASGQCASALYVFWGPCANSTCESAQLYFPIQWEADCVASNPIVTVDFTAPIVNSGVASATIEGNSTTVYGEVSDDQMSVTFGMGESGVDPSSYDSGWSGFLVSLDNCDTSYTWSDNFFEVSYVDDEQNTIDLSAFEDPDIEIPDTGICPTPSPVTPSPAAQAPVTNAAASPTEAGSSLALGCYEDDPEDRIMDNLALSDSSMTTELCELTCVGSTYFATQYRQECWCGSADADYAQHGESTGCTYACSGDSAQTCGGFNAANVYRYPDDSTPSPTPSPSQEGPYPALGCYADDSEDRIMDELVLSDSSMTTELCELTCEGSTYFATQYGRECWCGSADADYTVHGESTDCTYPCSGDADQTCGGFDAANVYRYPDDSTPSPTPSPTTFVALGCYGDDREDRIMDELVLSDSSMTTELCELTCLGSTYFATQYGSECWCGSAGADYTVHGESTICTYACSGDADQTCGGYDAANVYRYTAESTPDPTPSPTEAVSFVAVGCYEDDPEDRIMDDLVLSDPSMTTELCEETCAGNIYFATQYGRECWCGSAGADHTLHGESTDCTYACSGDADQTCGGFDAANVYRYTDGSTPSPTPTPTEAAPFVALGCYGDDREARIMDDLVLSDSSMTTELCELTCLGSTYFATQYGRECWCGSDGADYTLHGESTDCTYPCSGDADQICGGFDAANVYLFTGETSTSSFVGCYQDEPDARIMEFALTGTSSMTMEMCEAECTGNTYFGMQYGTECFCGGESTDLLQHGESTACDYECSGDSEQVCGGFYAMSVYSYS
ncbi:unnamed protein product, partial [Ectocarpus sp. 6 AP-2014]